jgi:hypothetical protein
MSSERHLTGQQRSFGPATPRSFTDGPFAAAKEAVGGFYVVESVNREAAVELAAKVPQSPGIAVEVLTIAKF